MLVYDNRPFLDWYCNFARRRNGPGPDIEISLGSSQLGPGSFNGLSDRCTCGVSVDPMLLMEQGVRIDIDPDSLPQTPTSPSLSDNSQWLRSIYQPDNLAVMRRLSYMWMHPVNFGIVRMGEVLERIFQVKGVRENGLKPKPIRTVDRPKMVRTVRDDRTDLAISRGTAASKRCSVDDSGSDKEEERGIRAFNDEMDEDGDAGDDNEVGYNLQRCVNTGVREHVREIRWCDMEGRSIQGDDSEECMFDVDFYEDEEL